MQRSCPPVYFIFLFFPDSYGYGIHLHEGIFFQFSGISTDSRKKAAMVKKNKWSLDFKARTAEEKALNKLLGIHAEKHNTH